MKFDVGDEWRSMAECKWKVEEWKDEEECRECIRGGGELRVDSVRNVAIVGKWRSKEERVAREQ